MRVMNVWIDYGKSWKEFVAAKLNKPGTLIEIRSPWVDTEEMLIGDVNNLGGLCDDCALSEKDTVKRYRVVWTPE